VGGDLADAVNRAVVEASGAVGLCLQADTHVLDGAGNNTVGDAGEGTREVVLGVAQSAVGIGCLGGSVPGGKLAAGVVEGAELDRYLGG